MHGDEVDNGTVATLICQRRRRVGGDIRPATVIGVRRDDGQRIYQATVRDEVSGMLLVFVVDEQFLAEHPPVRFERVTSRPPHKAVIERILPPDPDAFGSGDYLHSQWPAGRTPDALMREIRISVGDRAPRFPDTHPPPRGPEAPAEQKPAYPDFGVRGTLRIRDVPGAIVIERVD